MLNDRQSPLTASKLTNIRSGHEGRDFQDSEWMTIKGQTTTQNEQKSQWRAGMQSKHWQTTLRSKRWHELKQAPSCCDWLCVNHLGFSLTPPPLPPFTFQERKIQYKMEKQNNKKKNCGPNPSWNAKAFTSLICAGYWLTACGSEKCAKLAYLEQTLSALRSDILTRRDSLPWNSV